ncbi:glycosyltransferase family A protein [Litoribacter populi]|uniref:glycosyltransferase family A protein n=1 Tax=Litoribacter populi TaxID=2598460 RepID=UPI00163D7694|nr:glycosyltransferase family A protein [Litoribacter populi]
MKVSVIIPCYNQGNYIKETISSVINSNYSNFEIVIVNDGSDDLFTLKEFAKLETEGFTVLHKENGGLSSARNFGIMNSIGELILPLDSDDKISKDYIKEAVEVFQNIPNSCIVYSKAKLFGYQNKKWNLPQFSLKRFLSGNIIFCSAFFKKEDWERVGGYDENMRKGFEDWEFWMKLLNYNPNVFQLNSYHFFYRVREDSMARTTNIKYKKEVFDYIYEKHKDFIIENLGNPLLLIHELQGIKELYNRIDSKIGRILLRPVVNIVGRFFNS